MRDWRNSRAWRMLVSRYGESEARAIVYYVMETCFNIKKEDFLADGLDSLRPEQVPRLMAMLFKTAEGTPVQYVTGLADFGGRHGYTYIGVSPGVLIPRPETAELCDWIIDDYGSRKGLDILDACTGSGCIAVMLKLVMPECRLWAWDNSLAALGTARRNASAKGIDIVVEYQDVLDIRTAERRWDVIASNPPYVLDSEKKDIEEHVIKHEPAEALFVPDGDPLRFYTPIARYAAKTLRPGGALYFELNPLTADKTADMVGREGFAEVEIREDCYGKRRIMKARMAD